MIHTYIHHRYCIVIKHTQSTQMFDSIRSHVTTMIVTAILNLVGQGVFTETTLQTLFTNGFNLSFQSIPVWLTLPLARDIVIIATCIIYTFTTIGYDNLVSACSSVYKWITRIAWILVISLVVYIFISVRNHHHQQQPIDTTPK
jgi:hypothetical protein